MRISTEVLYPSSADNIFVAAGVRDPVEWLWRSGVQQDYCNTMQQ